MHVGILIMTRGRNRMLQGNPRVAKQLMKLVPMQGYKQRAMLLAGQEYDEAGRCTLCEPVQGEPILDAIYPVSQRLGSEFCFECTLVQRDLTGHALQECSPC